MECKFSNGGICGHAECPMYYDECPVPYTCGICRYEDREEVWTLTPRGCLVAALERNNIYIDDVIDKVWEEFSSLMIKLGYAEEDEDE